MANPLLPKCTKLLKEKYKAFLVVSTGVSVSGIMDIVACVNGLFYGFEIKWKNDTPSELQKQKINDLVDSGGRGYFIKTVEQLIEILDHDLQPIKYEIKNHVYM